MKNIFYSICFLTIIISVESCNTKSNMVLYDGFNLKDYKYIVFGERPSEINDSVEYDLYAFPFFYLKESKNDPMPIRVKNEIIKYFSEVSIDKANEYANNGELVLSPDIKIKVEYKNNGHTFITVSFFDYHTNKLVAEIHSRGIAFSTAGDKNYAIKGVKRELQKLFK